MVRFFGFTILGRKPILIVQEELFLQLNVIPALKNR